MGFEDYISETEAATLAGVSQNTLGRFAEAGYLQIETDSDGLRMFSRRELNTVFGLLEPVLPAAPKNRKQDEQSDAREGGEDAVPPVAERPAPLEAAVDLEVVEAPPPVQPEGPTNGHSLTESGNGHEEEREWLNRATAISTDAGASTNAVLSTKTVDVRERELTKLKNIVELQEKLLDLREAEIADLKQQRDWLKQRVERLEEKSDRDQLLLLSETQLLRQMLTDKQQRQSPIRRALVWFGFAEPAEPATPSRKGTIDVSNRQAE